MPMSLHLFNVNATVSTTILFKTNSKTLVSWINRMSLWTHWLAWSRNTMSCLMVFSFAVWMKCLAGAKDWGSFLFLKSSMQPRLYWNCNQPFSNAPISMTHFMNFIWRWLFYLPGIATHMWLFVSWKRVHQSPLDCASGWHCGSSCWW